ncbi:MAG: hypothetical protein JWP97_5292 [Labilithrix sp.]|nr:hypothetical protein [Labilithrix sp.]
MTPEARVPALRLVRSPRAWLQVAAWAVLGLMSALFARGSGSGADHVMRGPFAVVVLPLVAYAIVAGTVGVNGLRVAIRGVVSLGAEPRRAALSAVGVAVVAGAAAGALLGPFTCAAAHVAQDPPLGADAFASLWIGALGGAAYAAYFCAGCAIGRGRMRWFFLVFDYVAGASGGVLAWVTPRAHVQALLGGERLGDLSPRVDSVALLVLLALYVALAARLARRV